MALKIILMALSCQWFELGIWDNSWQQSLQENEQTIEIIWPLSNSREDVILLYYTYNNQHQTIATIVPSVLFVRQPCPCVYLFHSHTNLYTHARHTHTNTMYLLWPTLSTSFMDLVLHTPPSVLSRPCRAPVDVAGIQREEANVNLSFKFMFHVIIIIHDYQPIHSSIMIFLGSVAKCSITCNARV